MATDDQTKAEEVLKVLFDASTNEHQEIEARVNTIIGTDSWKENIATKILYGIQIALEKKTPMGTAMALAFEKSVAAAFDFEKEHPVYFAIIALGISAVMLPWALEALGFAELGIVEGMTNLDRMTQLKYRRHANTHS